MSQLVEQTVRHQVFLERLKSGEVSKFAPFLKRIDAVIRKRLSGDVTEYSRGRMERLLASIDDDLKTIFSDHRTALQADLFEVADYEAGFESRSINKVAANFETVVPASSQVSAAVLSAPLSVRGANGGKLLTQLIKDWSPTEIQRVTGAIRQGFFEGQTTQQIVRTVRGTRANKYRDGLLATTDRNASAVVRTAVQHVASVARQETWSANSDIIKKVRWLSTLDSRTSPECQNLDGQEFPIDSGPRPPIHINCRSTTVAVLDERYSFLSEGGTRSSRGPDGVSSVDAKESYYGWLKKQPADFQNEAIGPVRGKLLRNGGLTAERFRELSVGKNFQPLTLLEMKEIEPLAFTKAGI